MLVLVVVVLIDRIHIYIYMASGGGPDTTDQIPEFPEPFLRHILQEDVYKDGDGDKLAKQISADEHGIGLQQSSDDNVVTRRGVSLTQLAL